MILWVGNQLKCSVYVLTIEEKWMQQSEEREASGGRRKRGGGERRKRGGGEKKERRCSAAGGPAGEVHAPFGVDEADSAASRDPAPARPGGSRSGWSACQWPTRRPARLGASRQACSAWWTPTGSRRLYRSRGCNIFVNKKKRIISLKQ